MTNNDLSIKPLSGKRAFELISDQIRDQIYAGKLKPGDKLPSERELAEKFNAGRTAVREGLRFLEQSGLISVKQGSEGGSFVREVDTSIVSKSLIDMIRRSNVTVDQLIEVRMGVERLVLASAMARITKKDLNLLKNNIEEAEAILEDAYREKRLPDLDLWVETNSEFHSILARATLNPLFEAIVEALSKVLRNFLNHPPLVPKYFRDHIIYHRAVYEAIKEGNLSKAERNLGEHIQWVGGTLVLKDVSSKEEDRG